MNVHIKKNLPNLKTPIYSKIGDAGLDFYSSKIINESEWQITYDTDISIEIPIGYVGLIFPRSSIRNYDIELSNSVGVIDSGYRGNLQATFNKIKGNSSKVYGIGERIFQLMILKYPLINLIEVEGLTNTDRGSGGFGSTN